MKIAVLGPSPVPYTIGGVENLLWGLCETINQKTPHQAELIKLPSREHDFWSLIESYYAFYTLDLNHFDAVICTKYPSWMIEHRNCIYYIAHRLRGLYDTYHFCGLPTEVLVGNPHIDSVVRYIQDNHNPLNLDNLFEMLFSIKSKASEIPNEYFHFPGPFIRMLIHYMDNYAMTKNIQSKFYSISQTVKYRKEYFPPNANVRVVYPPSSLKEYKTGEYHHIYFVSRLDAPKRVDMLIDAMKFVSSDIKLYIAGTGPLENELHAKASGDKRIEFLGFINDETVEEYYANSLVIPFFPYEEDYGLITIEAMMHRKPVITTNDAGGPTEFVIDGQTGFCTQFDARAIGEKIDFFARNPKEAERMGVQAYEKVKGITWENTVSQILNTDVDTITNNLVIERSAATRQRKKITVAATFPIYPPLGGGQARIFDLYKNLASEYNIEIVSLANMDQPAYEGVIAPNLREIRTPKTTGHQQKEWDMFESKVSIPVSDIAALSLLEYTPEYGKKLAASLESSDYVIISHPYALYEVKKYKNRSKIVYEAHNVESRMKREMLPNNQSADKFVQMVFDAEKECCDLSEWVMACSFEDRQELHDTYGIALDKISVVPNGVDCEQIRFTTVKERLIKKENLGLGNEKIAIFMGSWHGPNLEACEEIIKFAPLCPDVKFLLMGSQCQYFQERKMPKNVGLLGLVSQERKAFIFQAADFALNPMCSGSGTNLKMFEYMASGIPIITTKFGARGIDDESIFHVAEIAHFSEAINSFTLINDEDRVQKARKCVESKFDWKVIADIVLEKLG